MKAMSFNETQPQYRARRKIDTRRVSCRIRPGEEFMAVEKMQWIKKGAHRVSMGTAVCYSVSGERVDEIIRRPVRKVPDEIFPYARTCCRWYQSGLCTPAGMNTQRCCITNCPGIRCVDLEGFPRITEEQFVDLLLRINRHRFLKRDSVIQLVRFIPRERP